MILKKIPGLLLLLQLVCLGCSEETRPKKTIESAQFLTHNKIAFKDVNVVTMEDESILNNVVLLVENGKIKALQSPSNPIPDGYQIIETNGQYIMPGLADMHSHAIEENDMFLYLANGVTNVRHMWGSAGSLSIKQRIEDEEVLGPHFYAASPGFEEPPSFWPGPVLMEDVNKVSAQVLEQKEQGFDFIKSYNNMSEEMYRSLMAAALEHEIKVVGHVSPRVGILTALELGHSSIAHVDGYLEFAAIPGSDINSPESYQIDQGKLDVIVEKTVEANVWNCPTITITTRNLSQKTKLESNPELRFVSPRMRKWFESPGSGLTQWSSAAYTIHKMELIKKMNDRGAKLLLGVDTGLRYLLPGFTVHEELENFVAAGLSPFEALQTATINPALFLEKEMEFGTISVGKRADLVLLSSNPLENISHTRKISGVLLGNTWMSKSEIDKRMNEIAESYE